MEVLHLSFANNALGKDIRANRKPLISTLIERVEHEHVVDKGGEGSKRPGRRLISQYCIALDIFDTRQPVGLSGEIGRKREELGARQVNMARLSVEPVAQDLHASNVQTLVYKRLWVGFPVAVYDLDIVEDKIVLKLCN